MSMIFDNIGIDPGIIIIVLLIIVLILIGSAVSMSMRMSRLERKYKMFMKEATLRHWRKDSSGNLLRLTVFMRRRKIMNVLSILL